MSEPMREAVIDAGAILRNVRRLRRVAGTREFIAVVKANGYGHGAETAARAALAGGASRLGVAEIPEALALRSAGIDAPLIAWLHGPHTGFAEAVHAELELGAASLDQLRRIAALAPTGRPIPVHLKLETGLGRNGIAPEDWGAVVAEAASLERDGRIRVEGIFSHLSNASAEDDRAALAVFEDAVGHAANAGVRPRIRHLAASHATFARPETRLDAVRVGVSIYGQSPFEDASAADLGLHPAMTLRAAVAAVRRVPAGHGVSYSYTYRTPRETTLALVPLGYADGVPRQASNRGPVVVNGAPFTVSGRIAMDQLVVDVGDHPVAVGDEAVLFGDPAAGVPSAADWGDAADTINYEIVTRIGNRVPRRVLVPSAELLRAGDDGEAGAGDPPTSRVPGDEE